MRITCPKCGAIYEIDADLVPASGRDVQCSACSHVWSESPPRAADAAEAAGAEAAGAETPPDTPDESDEAPRETAGGDGPARSRPDEDTLRILREEAAREVAKRRGGGGDYTAEAAPEPEPSPREDARGVAPLTRPDREEEPRAAPADRLSAPVRGTPAPAGEGARRRSEQSGDLLPDVDEINSTLAGPARRAPDREGDGGTAPAAGGFLSGFVWVLAIAIVVAAAYVAAPWIAERLPALEGPLAGLVGAVNAARDWLGTRLDLLSEAISALGA